jgi:hypothetical protein
MRFNVDEKVVGIRSELEHGGVSRYPTNDVEDLRKLSLSLAYDQDQRNRHEWWCLWRLFACANINSCISFLILIANPDPPDFIIEHGEGKIALEMTQATYELYEQITRTFRANPGSVL